MNRKLFMKKKYKQRNHSHIFDKCIYVCDLWNKINIINEISTRYKTRRVQFIKWLYDPDLRLSESNKSIIT